ncbi:MAG: HAMP domain-containing histidine kinase [Cytophagales bacterium]|nr:HAMP domain-containing histidine kinase [Cytophagales bacterium]
MGRCILLLGFLVFVQVVTFGQSQNLVQVKAFDSNLQPVRNLPLTLNKKLTVNTGDRGTIIATLADTDLPIQSIEVGDATLEVASWNLSKGVLEVVVRKKNYRMQSVVVRDNRQQAVANATVTYSGSKKITLKTDELGRLELPVPLADQTITASQIIVEGYTVSKVETINTVLTITAFKELPRVVETSPVVETPLKNYAAELVTLDTVRNLSDFYKVIRNLNMDNIDGTEKEKIDVHFSRLLNELVATSGKTTTVPELLTDSTTSGELKRLIARATEEGKELEQQRTEFDKRIAALSQKLSSGIANMDSDTRDRLLNDIVLLERLLDENETRFRRNQGEYKQVINSLKSQYFDIQVLEDKLTESERLRLEEQRVFRQRLLLALVLGIIFAILILMLARFSARLRKQKKQLIAANDEVRQINENLESIVLKRTQLLQAANSELDTFLYRAAHDLRTPVASIFGLINLSQYLTQTELLEKVKSSTEKMDRLLSRLNIISQINQPTGLGEVSVADLFKDLETKFGDRAAQLSAKLYFNAPGEIRVTTYRTLLAQCLNSLVENALHFSTLDPKPASVEVMVSHTQEAIRFTIADNGPGIEKDILSHLYKMFFKGSEKSEGHGLGLYILHRCLSPLKGTIEVKTQVGVGTTFTLTVPVALKV